jgi:hypothetical protein
VEISDVFLALFPDTSRLPKTLVLFLHTTSREGLRQVAITPSVWEKIVFLVFVAGLRLVVIFMRWSKYIENAKFCAESDGGGAFYRRPPHPF